MKILVIEDDYGIIEAITFAFKVGWPEVEIISAENGEDGLKMVDNESPSMVILDLGLPDTDGFSILKQIRLFYNIPVVILTVSGEENNVIKGLELGADEYITKPFRPLEMIARIKKALKNKDIYYEQPSLDYGWLKINLTTRIVVINEKAIQFTGTELLILHYLAINAGKAIANQVLAERVWGNDYPDSNKAIRVYIRRIRKKIEEDSDSPKILLTCPGMGYMLVKPAKNNLG
ncbi:MAG: response regulator transcription factor [Peptococcaceae bacterium]